MSRRRKSIQVRSGISLMEVMFSIGVVIIGVLGAVALLPVAARHAERGVTADRMAYVGKSAVQEFSLRGYGRPDQWVSWFPAAGSGMGAGGPGIYPLMRPGQTNPAFGQWFASGTWTFSPAAAQSFCIDPRFVAVNAGNTAGIYNAQLFPYYDPSGANDPRMARITIKANPAFPRVGMGPLQAEEVFTSHDALAIDLPKDRTLPPVQRFHSGPAAPIKRDFQGKLSWMATLVPKLDETGEYRDLYTLSIVVFKNRDTSFAMDAGLSGDGTPLTNNERLADVVFTGGPEVRLITVNTSRPQSDLDLDAREWLMLGAITATTNRPVFRWYRVIATDDDAVRWGPGPDGVWGSSGDDDLDGITDNAREAGWPGSDDEANPAAAPFVYTRYATLDGPDWDLAEWGPGGRWNSANGSRAFRHTRATLVTGVVTVYEKTIRLESTSLWNQ